MIGFVGNFIPSYSTENDRLWSLQKLGYDVMPLQENEIKAQDLIDLATQLDCLFYSHTHGWEIENLKEVFIYYKDKGIPTVSIHLDRWVGLDRVKDVGKEATWFTEYIFMADGSPEAVELYDSLNLNWRYLKPGVIERDCYQMKPDPISYPHEIVFIGSKGYHPEYPFRAELVDFLHKTYGDRFGHYGNDGIKVVREYELNRVLSTAKVVVGDSCFAGTNNYVSDRYYETRGRNGFLLHPFVKGVDIAGVGFYKASDLESLKLNLDFYLEQEELREGLRQFGFNHVKTSETYTNRMKEVMNEIGLNK